MPKNKVNNNIKLKSGGGVINDADGLQVDTGTTDGKIVQMTTGDKLPAVDGSLLTNTPWTFISTSTGSSSSESGVPSAANVAIPTGTRFIVIQGSTQQDEGTTNRYYTAQQLILIPGVITSAYYRYTFGTSDEFYKHFTATITGTNVVLTSNISGGGGATGAFSGVCYFFK